MRTRAIPERFCGRDSLERGALSSVFAFTFTTVETFLEYGLYCVMSGSSRQCCEMPRCVNDCERPSWQECHKCALLKDFIRRTYDNDCGSEGQWTASSDAKLQNHPLSQTHYAYKVVFYAACTIRLDSCLIHSTLRESIQYRNNSEVRTVNRICRPRVMLLRTIKRYKAKSSEKKKLNRDDIE